MTLLKAILRAQSKNESKYASPPPEGSGIVPKKKKIMKTTPSSKIHNKIDCSAPLYDPQRLVRKIPVCVRDVWNLYRDNIGLVIAIKKAHYKGKVDSRWSKLPPPSRQYYEQRVYRYTKICRENKQIYKRIVNTRSRVERASSLDREWQRNKLAIVHSSQRNFVLFSLKPEEIIEDPAFVAPDGVKRPRVYITLQIRNAAVLGTIALELFTDICPQTCGLFLELLDGDEVGYGYVGTKFFSKVSNLYWSGGDVVHNNGFGCYAQRGRFRPIGAETYHFSHSMPGLLSMRVTANDEVCGIFNITFKVLPQLDLRNVVFGRIIRPNSTYEHMKTLGSPFSPQPIVEIVSTKGLNGRKLINGNKNTKLASIKNQIL